MECDIILVVYIRTLQAHICHASARPPASQSTAPHFPSSLDRIRNQKARTGLIHRSSLIELRPQNRQALIWEIFRKHENIPDDISDLHLRIDDFKANIKKEFNFLKEATSKNVENFQTSLNLQQTYSAALCSHINNIYHKISEKQHQLPHPTQHMNTGDVIQIDALDFDPDINGGLPTKEHEETQGSDSLIQQPPKKSDERKAPALLQQDVEEVDWPDAIPVEIPPQPDQDNEQNIPVLPIRCETNLSEIPQLESDIEEEEEGQFEYLQTYLTHHNTYQESQNIRKDYRKKIIKPG